MTKVKVHTIAGWYWMDVPDRPKRKKRKATKSEKPADEEQSYEEWAAEEYNPCGRGGG